MSYLDSLFGLLSGRFGWVFSLGALLATLGVALLLWRKRPMGALRWLAVVLVLGGLAAAVLLAIPYGLVVSRPKDPLGPFQVQRAELLLRTTDPTRTAGPIRLRFWFPVAGPPATSRALNTCADLHALPLAAADGPRRLLLYMPRMWGPGDDNAARLSYLASFGYVAVAFDDIALDPAPIGASAQDEAVRLIETHDATTQQGYDERIAKLDVRVRREAEKALAGLDWLTTCAASNPTSPWSRSIDYAHVGFLGFSSGGAAAAEASVMDSRIAAVVNLDGYLFGQAFAADVPAPYLFVMSGRPVATLAAMTSETPMERYGARIEARDLRPQARLAARPGSAGVRIEGSVHANLGDMGVQPGATRLWLLDNPVAYYNVVNRYTRDFFDARLRGREVPWMEEGASVAPFARTFTDMGMTPDGNFAWPPPQDASGAPAR